MDKSELAWATGKSSESSGTGTGGRNRDATYRRFRKLTLLVKLLLKLAKDSVPACGSCVRTIQRWEWIRRMKHKETQVRIYWCSGVREGLKWMVRWWNRWVKRKEVAKGSWADLLLFRAECLLCFSREKANPWGENVTKNPERLYAVVASQLC